MAKQPASPAAARSILEALAGLQGDHGGVIDVPAPEAFAPGAAVNVTVHSPRSVERFALDARARLPVGAIQVLPTGIVLEILVPGPEVGA